jgi:predicted metal-dependent hydrolase
MIPSAVVSEVKDFLAGLRRDLPDLFPRRERASGPGPSKAPPAQRERLRSRGGEPMLADPQRELFTARVRHWSGIMGVEPKRIFLKNQRTRWASCSEKGNLNFNRRLAEAPREVVDYVVIHELSHLVEMNHSRRFWAVVERWCPGHKSHRSWLRRNSGLLLRRRAN